MVEFVDKVMTPKMMMFGCLLTGILSMVAVVCMSSFMLVSLMQQV